MADEYPFLDPFAAKFQYKDGVVTFTGEVKQHFSQAIGESLLETVKTLAEKAALDGNDLFMPIRNSLTAVKSQYQDQIDRFNISGIVPDLFGYIKHYEYWIKRSQRIEWRLGKPDLQ